jgi:hypothetical protein
VKRIATIIAPALALACTLPDRAIQRACNDDHDCLPGRTCTDRRCQDQVDAEVDARVDARVDAVAEASVDARDDAGAVDLPLPVAVRCDPTSPFTHVTWRADLADLDECNGVTLSRDELTVFVTGTRSGLGTSGLYSATRPSARDAFGALIAVDATIPQVDVWAPRLTDDGAWLYFNSDDVLGTTYPYRIRRSPRDGPGGGFLPGQVVAELPTGAGDPSLTANRALLFYSRLLKPAGDHDIFVASRASANDTFDVNIPQDALVNINSPYTEWRPVISGDGLRIYFSSSRPDGGAWGGADIWTSQRATIDQPFPPPTDVSELNTPADDDLAWLSVDGCVAFLLSNAGPSGTTYAYEARRASAPDAGAP